MLTNIKVKNYKGFKEAEIPIRPITILLGSNSSGKSSILQLLLLLQQTAEERTEYKSALKIFGNRISVGKPENLFYGLDYKKPIYIQINFNNEQVKSILEDAFSDYILDSSMFYFGAELKNKLHSADKDEIRRAFEIGLAQYKNDYFRGGYSGYISEYDLIKKDCQSLMRTYDFLDNLHKKIKNTSFSFSYTISYVRKNLVISDFSFMSGSVSILSYKDSIGFSSEIIDLNENDNISLKASFLKNSTIFNIFGERKFWGDAKKNNGIETSLAKTMIILIKGVLFEFQKEFKEQCINYVGPLRAHPQRYYMLDKANVTYSLDTYDANAIAEVIKDKKVLKDRVNDWFKQFGLEVTVDEFKESIHKLTVCQSNLHLDIPDVGFGVSQVLPVVMQGFLSPNRSITIVEQPEVHLHPKMQASLADLFIDIIKESKYSKHLLVETHSEYLLKRLRRRMAEGNKITPDKVSINLFHTRTCDSPATIENLQIENKGAFNWPEEYYDNELYKDVVEFLKLQANDDIYTNN